MKSLTKWDFSLYKICGENGKIFEPVEWKLGMFFQICSYQCNPCPSNVNFTLFYVYIYRLPSYFKIYPVKAIIVSE